VVTRFQRWRDIIAAVTLCAVVSVEWCNANQMWTAAAWRLPTSYLGPYDGAPKSDVLLHLAFIRAARDGHFVPLRSKIVPELGAPYQASWNDWPITEELPIFGMGMLARGVGIFAALNVALLSCHLLAALSFYFVARYRRIDIIWSFAGALAFGLASFIFSESPDHVLVALCWHVPLFILVWDWVSSDRTLTFGSERFWCAVLIAMAAGLQMPYYAAIFIQLVLIGAFVTFIRVRRVPELLSALCVAAATAFAFALMNLDTWLDQFRFGSNPQALVRQYQWVEIYGLKLVDLIVPPLNHQWPLFRSFAAWRAHTQILHDEGSYFGIVGICALVLLTGMAVRALIERDATRVPKAFWQVLWIFIYFATGGLNAVVALPGFRFLRTGCRFSIVILAISLLFAAEWLMRYRQRRFLSGVAIAVCCFIIVLDQVPKSLSPNLRAMIAQQVLSDQKFVTDIEAALPQGAMVFQLPVMDFPESPLRTESAYDHLRPYLYTHHLHFSFGSVKGRSREEWQHEMEKMSLPDSIAEVKSRGFSALYVSRVGYPDGARDLQQNLQALGYRNIIQSSNDDLFCVLLQ